MYGNIIGKRIKWTVYGVVYSGIVTRVIEEDGMFLRKGDIFAKMADGQEVCCHSAKRNHSPNITN